MLKPIATLFLFIAVFSVACAQSRISEEVKASIKVRVDEGETPGIVVGIIDADGPQYYSYGVKSLKTKESVNENSVFEIGSITKTFTGILLADMVIKGEASLDDPVQKFLPSDVKAPTRNGAFIKLVNLSNHTSSLPRMPDNFNPGNPANPFADYSEKQLYDFLNAYPLPRDIGSQYEYSNYAVGLLGHLLAAKKGVTYEKLMIDIIAGPLKLNDTRIAFTPKMKANLAMGHNKGVEVENWDIISLAGAGAIRSTAVDMLNYIRANLGIGNSKLYQAMQLSHKDSKVGISGPIVGLGWHKIITEGLEITWHNGGTGGYRTFAGFANNGKGVVVLTNSTVGADDIGFHLLNPKSPLQVTKPSIGLKIRNIIDTQGIEQGLKAYRELKKDQANDYDFSEGQLIKLGEDYLGNGEMVIAITVLTLNTEVYPESSPAFYSLGKAFLITGNKEKSMLNFRKSVELNPGNQDAIQKLKELGVSDVAIDVVVDTETLESYAGKYELAPGFILTVTRDGSQLKTQATGQSQVDIFPKSKNVFYLKVVEAQLTFNQNTDGKVESVTLHQGGQVIVGKRLN
jgi:D-alanyl-D-alanine-carboxypeptidase/D-alanyl-D-alanine-endopeptidase